MGYEQLTLLELADVASEVQAPKPLLAEQALAALKRYILERAPDAAADERWRLLFRAGEGGRE